MTPKSTGRPSQRATADRGIVVWGTALLLLLAACSDVGGPPPLKALTESDLDAAEQRWAARGADSYHLAVKVKAIPRTDPVVYDVMVANGEVAGLERDGQVVTLAEAYDYSVQGLFHLLRDDLPLTEGPQVDNDPVVDLQVRFDAVTGRLELYRRRVSTARRDTMTIEVLEYEPATEGSVGGSVGGVQ